MPQYEYVCAEDHVTSIVRSMRGVIPKNLKCRRCRKRANRIFSTPAVQDDFPEHFNISMGTVVKNRAHHKQLQKALGCHDYESNGSHGSQLVQDRLRK